MRSLILALAFVASGCGARSGLECPEPLHADAGRPDARILADSGTDAGVDAGGDAGIPASTCDEPEPGGMRVCGFMQASPGIGGGCHCRTCPPRSDGRDLAPGMLIRWEGNYQVYVIGRDGRRHAFPSEVELMSWFGEDTAAGPVHHWVEDGVRSHICNHVAVVTSEVLGRIPLAGSNVTVRPGTYVLGLESVPDQLYVVDRGGVLRPIAPSVADAVFAPSARFRSRIIEDAFFVSYTLGPPVASVADYDRAALARVTLLDDLDARR